MEQTDKERRDKIAQILRDGITFSGQVGDYVIHGAIDELIKYNETQVIPLREQIRDWEKRYNDATERNIDLRERLEKVEKENEQLTQWHRDWVSGKWVKEQTANIDRLIKENERLRERLEKVEKALKEARDVLVMASLIDKTSTCMDAVNEIDQLLTKEG